jgi:hypothetical protein
MVKTVGTRFVQIVPYQCLGIINVKTQNKINPKTGAPLT